jgi:hypothetical protein
MAVTKERERSPLNCIPSVDAVRQRLEAVLKEARKLRILLRTAKEIEDTERREDQPRE